MIQSILVADDDRSIGKLFQAALAKYGVTVTMVYDGAEAVEAVKGADFDLAFIDMEMPNMDGIETISLIKRKKPKMKIYAISGGGVLDKKSYLELAESVGADEILVKPFSMRQIVKLVKQG